METVKYGLLNTATSQLLEYDTTSNPEDTEGVSVSYTLTTAGNGHPWLVDDAMHAEWVRNNSTPWYNAGYETPEHSGEIKQYDLKVVKVVMTTSQEPVDIQLPDINDVIDTNYANDPGKEYVRKQYQENKSYPDLYQVKKYLQLKGQPKQSRLIIGSASALDPEVAVVLEALATGNPITKFKTTQLVDTLMVCRQSNVADPEWATTIESVLRTKGINV
jgi:hypothetical protein